ncbi:MAG: FtsX-like permease family protein [Bryobacteraceae bacterium]
MRSSSYRFLFVALAVAAGVGALTGVRGFSQSFRGMLLSEARTLMAGDLSTRMFALPNEEQFAALEDLASRGVTRTWVTETLSMASSASTPDPLLVSIKAVDPKVYPFYGNLRLEPALALREALTPESVALSEDLELRLGVPVGGTVRVGGQDFRVAAIVASEPDRMSGSLNVGLRLLMSREALDRTGLIRPGSRAAQRFLFKLSPQSPGVEEVRGILRKIFPEARVIDFRETHPSITRGLNRSTTFLSLVSLIALIVGALGVAMAMHAHIQQKMDSIAIMKSLGGRSGQILRIYLLQAMMLGLGGGLLGVAVGSGIQALFPALIAKYFHVRPDALFNPGAAVQGLAAGLLTTLLFTLPPLLSIRRIRPGIIFRREMPEARLPWRTRARESRAAWAAAGGMLLGLGGIAAWLSDSVRLGAWFAGGLVTSLIALTLVAWILLRSLRAFLRRSPWRIPAMVRHGMANLYRPGNQAEAVLVALGVGVMFTLTVYLVQRSLLETIVKSAPPGMPNVFLLDITEREREPLLELIQAQPGLAGKPQIVPSVAAKLSGVNGTPLEELRIEGWGRRWRSTRSVSWQEELPEHTTILQGQWWPKGAAEPMVSVAEETAKILNLSPGSRIEMLASGRTIQARVAAVHRTEAIRLGATNDFLFNASALAGLPTIYYGGVRMQPGGVVALQREAYRRFPTVTVVNVVDALEVIQEMVDQIALVVRFLSAFAIIAGAVILASSVAGTRFRRIREVVILKTLGGTRRRVARIFSVEFSILGLVAGVMGSVLATAFSAILLKELLDAEFRFDPLPNAIAVVLTAVIANSAGWLASFRILGQKPLEVLRDE